MKNYASRAIQISYLEEDQLKRIQQMEKSIGYILPNFNLQYLLGLPTIKDKYGLPHENELLAAHMARIEQELQKRGFFKTDKFHDDTVDLTHATDWNVHRRAGEIVWEYAGAQKRYRGLAKAVEGLMGCFL